MSQLNDFTEALGYSGTRCEKILVLGKGHAFDSFEAIGGDVHRESRQPAESWILADFLSHNVQ